MLALMRLIGTDNEKSKLCIRLDLPERLGLLTSSCHVKLGLSSGMVKGFILDFSQPCEMKWSTNQFRSK